MEQNVVLMKEFYSISGFDTKAIFQREMVKIWQNAVFNAKSRKTVFRKELYSISGFDAKCIFTENS